MTTKTLGNTEPSGDGYSTFSLRQLISSALILICVMFGAELLNTISWTTNNISILWPSTGLLIGMMLCAPTRQWWAYLLVGSVIDFIANVLPPLRAPLAYGFYQTFCNAIEITLAAWLLRRSLAPERYMARAGQLVSLLAYGVILAPAVASFFAALGAVVGKHKAFSQGFSDWFTGDALGNAILIPLYLTLRTHAPFSRRRWYEVLGLTVLLGLVSVGVFWQTSLPLLFVILPVLLLVEVRLGMAGAALGLLMVSVIGGYFTARGHGPIGLTVFTLSPRTWMLQTFAFVSMLLLYIAEVVRAARNRFELNLHASEQRFRLLAEGSSDIITMTTLEGRLTYVSPAAATLLGWNPNIAVLFERTDLVHPEDAKSVEKLYSDCLAGKTRNILEFRARRKDGGYLWMEANLVLHRDPHTHAPAGFINVVRDISGRKAADEELNKALNVAESRAITDAVTGIANRRRLDEYLEKEWVSSQQEKKHISVLMIDVDHFKHYNDRYGHLAGDRCLREVTSAIASVARRPADFVGRYGGEEFVVVLPDTEAAGARQIAERIRSAVEQEQIPHEGNPHRVVTVSIGCNAMLPLEGDQSAQLLEGADAAMYIAKQKGRNCVRVDGDEAPVLWP